jgi:hypothetical protein
MAQHIITIGGFDTLLPRLEFRRIKILRLIYHGSTMPTLLAITAILSRLF